MPIFSSVRRKADSSTSRNDFKLLAGGVRTRHVPVMLLRQRILPAGFTRRADGSLTIRRDGTGMSQRLARTLRRGRICEISLFNCLFAVGAVSHAFQVGRRFEYVVRASLGHNQWVVLIYYPHNSDGHAARLDFDGSKRRRGMGT
jgi:hypothetical protein